MGKSPEKSSSAGTSKTKNYILPSEFKFVHKSASNFKIKINIKQEDSDSPLKLVLKILNNSNLDVENITVMFKNPENLQKTVLKKLKAKKQKTFEVVLKESLEELKNEKFVGEGKYYTADGKLN